MVYTGLTVYTSSTSNLPGRMVKWPAEGLAMPAKDPTQQLWSVVLPNRVHVPNYWPTFFTIFSSQDVRTRKQMVEVRMAYFVPLPRDLWFNGFGSSYAQGSNVFTRCHGHAFQKVQVAVVSRRNNISWIWTTGDRSIVLARIVDPDH